MICHRTVTAIALAWVGSAAQAWEYEYWSESGWTEVRLNSVEGDIGFHCAGLTHDNATGTTSPWATEPGKVIVSFGPDAIAVTARALEGIDITIDSETFALPMLEHSQSEQVYWTAISDEDQLFAAFDARHDMIVAYRGTEESRIAIGDAGVLVDPFLRDCAALTRR